MMAVRRYDDWGRLKKKFRSGKTAEDRKAREQAALARLHGTVSAVCVRRPGKLSPPCALSSNTHYCAQILQSEVVLLAPADVHLTSNEGQGACTRLYVLLG